MTLEKLARITQSQFRELKEEFAIKEDLKGFATKDDLTRFATKNELKELEERLVTKISQQVINSNDKLGTKIDKFLKEHAAHNLSHNRMDKTLENHGKRITKLEATVHPT